MSVQKKIENMDLEQISASGQCFRMWKTGENILEEERYQEGREETQEVPRGWKTEYTLIAGNRLLKVRQSENRFWFSCTEQEMEEFWKEYFDFSTDYGAVIDSVDPEDAYLIRAAAFGSGIRILKQDLWEMIVTFIISQQNNIRRIRKCIETICEKYGKKCSASDGTEYFAFPTPWELADASEEELRACGLGYRSRYLVKTSQMVCGKEIALNDLHSLPRAQAKEKLLALSGVGEKVADCILLFALHDVTAFPVDTHIRKVLEQQYPDGFPFQRYPDSAGILQQYIFYYDLMKQS